MCDKQDSTKYVWIFSWLCCRGDQTNTLLGKYGALITMAPEYFMNVWDSGRRLTYAGVRIINGWRVQGVAGSHFQCGHCTALCSRILCTRILNPASRTLQAAAHTLVLIAVRCCTNAVEMLQILGMFETQMLKLVVRIQGYCRWMLRGIWKPDFAECGFDPEYLCFERDIAVIISWINNRSIQE